MSFQLPQGIISDIFKYLSKFLISVVNKLTQQLIPNQFYFFHIIYN